MATFRLDFHYVDTTGIQHSYCRVYLTSLQDLTPLLQKIASLEPSTNYEVYDIDNNKYETTTNISNYIIYTGTDTDPNGDPYDVCTIKNGNGLGVFYGRTLTTTSTSNPNFIIKRGKQANLPTVKKSGTMYVTTDYPNIYIDISSSERISILPPYTVADEGKVLAIVDGKLTWVNQFDDFD